MGEAIETFAKEKNVRVIGRVPFDPSFTHAMVEGKTVIEFDEQGQGARAVKVIWADLVKNLEN
jgi:MinD superfamily P-loop ATPase